MWPVKPLKKSCTAALVSFGTYSKKTCCLSKSSTKKWPRRQGCFFFVSPRSGCTSTPVASVAMQKVVLSAYCFAAARSVSFSIAPTSPSQRLIVPRSMVTPSRAHDIEMRLRGIPLRYFSMARCSSDGVVILPGNISGGIGAVYVFVTTVCSPSMSSRYFTRVVFTRTMPPRFHISL